MTGRSDATNESGATTIEIALRERSVPIDLARLRRVLACILEDHGARGTLSLAIVGDEEIRRLHRELMGEDSPTDVISYPLAAGPLDPNVARLVGEVVVSAQTARREARKRRLRPATELAWYAIHGALHLVGYDDLEPSKKRVMRRRERKYLDLFAAGMPTIRRQRPTRRPRGRGARRPRSTDT